MADADTKAISHVHQTLRHSIVGYIPNPSRHPQITIKGKWLKEAGFTTGTQLNVRVMAGCLVITTLPPASELDALLQPAQQLSPQSQHELAQVIQGLVLREKLIPVCLNN